MRVYKILDAAEWARARKTGMYEGSEDDQRDGFIHLSSGRQAPETYRRHFRGRRGLVILALQAERLGPDLAWEPSSSGELYPHFYATMPAALVDDARQLDEEPG